MRGDAHGDGEGNDWLTQAALSSKGSKRGSRMGLIDAAVADDDSLAVEEVSTNNPSGGTAADSGEVAASADWLSAAAAPSSKPSPKAGSARTKNAVHGGAPTSGGWLASSIASGKLANLGDEGEISEVAGDSVKEIATQTDDAVTTEAAPDKETSEKPKSKLPPWAKPWTPPTPAPSADAHPTSWSSTDKDDRQGPAADKDNPGAGGRSSEGSGGLDWINATETGEEGNKRTRPVASIVVGGGIVTA